jgi:hypothetical protein
MCPHQLVNELATLDTTMMENANHAKDSLLLTLLSMYPSTSFPLALQNLHDPQIAPCSKSAATRREPKQVIRFNKP